MKVAAGEDSRDNGHAIIVAGALAAFLASVVVLGPQWATVSDFTSFHASARAVSRGMGDPYVHAAGETNNLNPPATILLFLPFAGLSVGAAFVAWTAAGLVCVWFAIRAISRELGIRLPLVLAAVIANAGALLALRLGQLTWVLLAVVTAAWVADRRGRSTRLGVLLGTLVYMKPFFGGFLIYLAFRRAWRALGMAVLIGAALLAVGVGLVGLEAHWTWVESIRLQAGARGSEFNASLIGLISRTTAPSLPQLAVTPIVDWSRLQPTLMFVSVISVVLLLARQLGRDVDRDWALLGVASVLLSPLGWVYYVPTLVGPILAATRTVAGRRRWLLLAGASVLCLAVPIGGQDRSFDAFRTLTAASAYSWGLLALFLSLVSEARDATDTPAVEAAPRDRVRASRGDLSAVDEPRASV